VEKKNAVNIAARCWDTTAADIDEADDQRDGAKGVQHGVEQGQGTKVRAGDIERRMKVDEIADQGAGQGADDDDGRDDRWRRAKVCSGQGGARLH
jgi:hypothetical protein